MESVLKSTSSKPMTTFWMECFEALDDGNYDKKEVLIQLRAQNLYSEPKVIESLTRLNRIIEDENEEWETKEQAGYFITDMCNNQDLELTLKVPMDTIKALISLLDSDEDILELQEAIVMLLASICHIEQTDKDKKMNQMEYRKYILFDTQAVKYLSEIIETLTYAMIESDKWLWISELRSFVYAMICFIPRGILLINEPKWFEQYGQYILNGICKCTSIIDRVILGDVCDGLSIIYILCSSNHNVAGLCAKWLKKLLNDGEYFVVKQSAKEAIITIVVECYIRKFGCSNRFPTDLVFTLVRYAGNTSL